MIQAANLDELSHAYLIEGERASVLHELLELFEKKFRIQTRGNPDVHIRQCETLTIGEGRILKQLASERAVSTASPKLFFVAFDSATREAQNSLLKLLEEPTPRTYFFVLVPNAELVLPTLRSRLMTATPRLGSFASKSGGSEEISDEAKQFLASASPERLDMIKEIVETKDKRRALELLSDVERTLYEKTALERMSEADRGTLSEISAVRKYISDRSSSLKLLLEHLALRL